MSNHLHSRSPANQPTAIPLRQHSARRPCHQRQAGATLIEFMVVALPLLVMGFLIVETAHWQMVRQIAYVALLDAARAGSTQQRRPDVIEDAFTEAFLPRFAGSGGRSVTVQQQAWDRIRQLSRLPAWQIEILQPDDTDILHARLTYLHEPLASYTRALLRHSARKGSDCVARAWASGLVPISMELRIEMYSQPIAWQTLPRTRDDRVVYGARDCAQ